MNFVRIILIYGEISIKKQRNIGEEISNFSILVGNYLIIIKVLMGTYPIYQNFKCL